MANRYKDEFPTFPGEYRREGLDHIKFLPYKELQKTCRAIHKGNTNTSKIYSACTKQYFFYCEDKNYFRPKPCALSQRGTQYFQNVAKHH